MKVRHPNLNEPNVLDVDKAALASYLAAGWVKVRTPRNTNSAPADTGTDAHDPADPVADDTQE